MIPYADYHLHTPLCGHAVGAPEEYAKQAVRMGLKEIGFSDHAPMVNKPMPGITMAFDDLPKYHALVEDVRKRYASQISIKIGLESDFLPRYEDKTKSMVEGYPYDYIIGSVHFIDDWAFDDPAHREFWKKHDVNEVYRQYYALLRLSAQTGLFQIIGHSDLPKKFGARPSMDMTDEIKKTAKIFSQTGVAVEINTAGLRKPVGEMYPSPQSLKIYREANVPLTFGSDAHDPQDVGKNFDKAVDLAKSVGYNEYLIFKNKKIEKRIRL